MRFEWDEDKNKSNRFKHGVWFEEARTVFYDRQYKFLYDSRHSNLDENRFLAIGFSRSERIFVVAHTYCQLESIRIISARLAGKKEKEFYDGRQIRLV